MRTDFAGITFYDGQGILVRIDDNFLKTSDLHGQSICVQANSTSASNIVEYYNSIGVAVEIRDFDERTTALKQYDSGACDAYTGDKSSLIAQQTLLSKPEQHMILPDNISREPLGPVVRHGDDNWRDIITWTIQCMINAEALDISQSNVVDMHASDNLMVKYLLGIEGELGQTMGLSNDFCYQIILQVGNFKDIYNRHLGPNTQFNLPRGLNALHSDGGLLYPLPFK